MIAEEPPQLGLHERPERAPHGFRAQRERDRRRHAGDHGHPGGRGRGREVVEAGRVGRADEEPVEEEGVHRPLPQPREPRPPARDHREERGGRHACARRREPAQHEPLRQAERGERAPVRAPEEQLGDVVRGGEVRGGQRRDEHAGGAEAHGRAPQQLEVLAARAQPRDEEREQLQDPVEVERRADPLGARQDGDQERDGHGPAQDAPHGRGQPPQEEREQEPGHPPGVEQAQRRVAPGRGVQEERVRRLEPQVGHEDAGDQPLHAPRLPVPRAGQVAGDEDERRHVEGEDEEVERPRRVALRGERRPGVARDDEDDRGQLDVVELGVAHRRRLT